MARCHLLDGRHATRRSSLPRCSAVTVILNTTTCQSILYPSIRCFAQTIMLTEKLLPEWVWYILSDKFLDQDALFVHIQERMLHEYGEYSTANKGEDKESDRYVETQSFQFSNNLRKLHFISLSKTDEPSLRVLSSSLYFA